MSEPEIQISILVNGAQAVVMGEKAFISPNLTSEQRNIIFQKMRDLFEAMKGDDPDPVLYSGCRTVVNPTEEDYEISAREEDERIAAHNALVKERDELREFTERIRLLLKLSPKCHPLCQGEYTSIIAAAEVAFSWDSGAQKQAATALARLSSEADALRATVKTLQDANTESNRLWHEFYSDIAIASGHPALANNPPALLERVRDLATAKQVESTCEQIKHHPNIEAIRVTKDALTIHFR